MPPGRPSIFSEEIAEEICTRLAEGQSLRRMCAENDHLPHRETVNAWCISRPGFSDRIADARAQGAAALVEEARDIADDGANDWMEKHHRETVSWVVNGEAVQRSRLRIDQRWREAEAHLPKVYGKRTAIEHSGHIASEPLPENDDELMAELLDLCATGRLKLPSGVELAEVDDEEPVTDPPADDDDPWGVG